jgi:phospholipase A1/A2
MRWIRCGFNRQTGVPVILWILVCLSTMCPSILCAQAEGDLSSRLKKCAGLDNNSERLKCFDKISGREQSIQREVGEGERPEENAKAFSEQAPGYGPAGRSAVNTESPESSAKTELSPKAATSTVLSRQWELDDESRKRAPLIRLHRPNYGLAAAYNSSPNRDAILDIDPKARAQNTEAKFQISAKIKLLNDLHIMGKDMDLWVAYTQLSFWQLYNSAFSSPFRETNYEPELLLNIRTDYDLLGLGLLKGRIVNLGINHQSNGRSEPLSRSWNRVVANFGFEKGGFNLLLKSWYRIPENARDDDNPDISKYMGYGEAWGIYYWNKHRFAAMLRNNLRPGDNRGAVQLDWSFPLSFLRNDRISGYIQYFNGYGESLLDYNKSVNRIGIGIMLTDWR